MNPALPLEAGGHFQGSVLGMILGSGAVVQFILALLLLFSVISWAIILMKYRNLQKISRENEAFLSAYGKLSRLADIFTEAKKYTASNLAEIFRSGYAELIKFSRAVKDASPLRAADEAGPGTIEKQGIDNVERALGRACSSEASKLERALSFLATTGSASPFIGLFGTVWGIMDTFRGIGMRGSATLAVVAPGISEALIATAAGLAAAIPAVIFYNYYLNRIKAMTVEMDSFATEILNIVERHYITKSGTP
jgi:biopolymer transport protein TolQ